MTVFAHSQTTKQLLNEAANDSTWVSGQDRKIPPAFGTNQITGFGGFRPLASLEKKKILLYFYNRTRPLIGCFLVMTGHYQLGVRGIYNLCST